MRLFLLLQTEKAIPSIRLIYLVTSTQINLMGRQKNVDESELNKNSTSFVQTDPCIFNDFCYKAPIDLKIFTLDLHIRLWIMVKNYINTIEHHHFIHRLFVKILYDTGGFSNKFESVIFVPVSKK